MIMINFNLSDRMDEFWNRYLPNRWNTSVYYRWYFYYRL